MTKGLRQKVYQKYNGKCSYCGCNITIQNFQVDHIWPQHLNHHTPYLNPDRFDNLNPSCRKCNNYKAGMKLELFRTEIQETVNRLKKNAQFDRAKRYGQIEITKKPIVFHFET